MCQLARWILCAVLCCALWLCDSSAAQEPSIRLQVTWGGGTARQWQGSASVANGHFTELVHLGLEADVSGAIYVRDQILQIRPEMARDYDGFEVLVSADLSAQLTLELAPTGQPQETSKIELSLSELISDYYYAKLDEQGNQILIHRSGGDALRVDFDRDSLVFAPGERFTFRVHPHLIALENSEALRCVVKMVEARTERSLWTQEVRLDRSPGGGFGPAGPFTVSMPGAEGAYDISISLYRKRFRDTFVASRAEHERKIQVVVIADQPADPDGQPWQLVDTIDPWDASWTDWIPQVPKLPLIPDFRREPVGDRKAEPRDYLGQQLVQLGNGGWQAYPVPIDQRHKPHLLEVEYPSDLSQTLGVSIIEPNAVGKVVPIGLDSGVEVPRGLGSSRPGILHHKLLFWPRSSAAFVLLTNRRQQGPAMFGKIRVYAGPNQLPAATASDASAVLADFETLAGPQSMKSVPQDEDSGQPFPNRRASSRLLAAYFEKPLFPENFSAPEAADELNGRSLDDWVTFLTGGRRLVEYLKYTGYNGAVISVACQGSTIYPSQRLAANPKHDTGIFFSTGQDPIRKDVLEMLFRMFDRAGLRLIPAVQFSAPLRELEALRRDQPDPDQLSGMDLVDSNGRAWTERHATEQGMAPYYNPLDPRVQAAMRRVLNEITDRYAHHRSFGGLSLELGPHTYANFPGSEWGQDKVTLSRFEQEAGYAETASSSDDKQSFRPRDRDQAWTNWRADKLADFYRVIVADLQDHRPDTELFLLGGSLFTTDQTQALLRPTLPNRLNLSMAMLQLGLHAKHYDDHRSIVLLRPERIASRAELAPQAVNINLSTNPIADQQFKQLEPAGSLFVHEPAPLSLPGFDQASPFGPKNTHTLLVTHVTPSASENRRRFVHRLALRDEQYLIDGGWMLPLGQEEAVRPLFRTLAQLPAQPFETVQPQTSTLPTQPIVVRRLSTQDRTYVYVVNDSPWTVSAEIDLQAPQPFQLTPLGDRDTANPVQMDPEPTWQLELQPFDIAAARMSSPQLEVLTWRSTIDRTAFASLRQQVDSIRARAGHLNRPAQVESLFNPGFEVSTDETPGWLHASGTGITIEPDRNESFRGNQSLKLASQGPVAWVRSEPIEPPHTGRISIIVRLKTSDPSQQPPLRLALEWRQDGQTIYKWANVGKGPKAKSLTSDWGKQPFMLQFNDLPTTGVENLQIGFDLMGPGEVWIDDVEVYHLWFLPNERDELMIMSALAARSLSKGQVSDCQKILTGYWPQFLRDYVAVEQTQTAALPETAPPGLHHFPPPQQQEPDPPEPQPEASMLDKMKRLPGKVLPFRMRY